MKKSETIVKNKIINHLLIKGKKTTTENSTLKFFKELQKHSSKNSIKLTQLALIYSIPIFKVHKIISKKKRKKNIREIPAFILNEKARISLAIKFILAATKKHSTKNLHQKLKEEILLTSKNKSESVKIKDELQKIVTVKKRFFKYYRWHS